MSIGKCHGNSNLNFRIHSASFSPFREIERIELFQKFHLLLHVHLEPFMITAFLLLVEAVL